MYYNDFRLGIVVARRRRVPNEVRNKPRKARPARAGSHQKNKDKEAFYEHTNFNQNRE